MSSAGVGIHRQQLPLDLGDRLRPGLLAALLLDDRVVRPEVPQVVRGHRADGRGHRERQAGVRGDLLAVRREQLRQPVRAVHQRGPLPGQVVEPDVVERDGLRRHVEQARERALIADRHVAQADGPVPGVQQAPW